MKTKTKWLNAGSKVSLNDFFKMFLATTISIVLTFGTSALLERREKKQAQKQMCMMILHDIDESITVMKESTEKFDQMFELQQQFREQPADWEDRSKRMAFGSLFPMVNFNESFEKIFTSSPDIWNTLGDAVFIDNVNQCYLQRQYFKDNVLKEVHSLHDGVFYAPLEDVLSADITDWALMSKIFMIEMERVNEYNKQLMGISDEDMKTFAKRTVVDYNKQYYDSLANAYQEEASARYMRISSK